MDRIRIIGGRPLSGEIPIGGAKNAALPLMAAGLLTEERLLLTRVPRLADIETMAALLSQHGIATEWDETARTISLGGPITNTEAPYDIVRKMRASFLVLGPLLARLGEARVSLPGGCGIGTRPVDIHLKGLEQLGAEIELDAGYVVARVNGRLRGATIIFPTVSVGATENVVMAASLAEGQTILRNSAREPEIIDLCHCLVAMGAQITGIGTGELVIEGVERLHAATHAIIPDRIETGTYACAVAMTGGDVLLRDARLDHLGAVARIMEETGVSIEQTERGVRIRRLNGLHGADVMTEPYPGFPTDMQAQFMAMVAVADGASMITESIFENRFMHVSELTRMGARVNVHGSSAIVRGVPSLAGAQVMATDLRASSSLILAGLAAKGETVVSRVYHLDRGYEDVEGKLSAVGAQIERLTD
ncbi:MULTISPECIES: UDP-N-acetylglucosamine 1-carboxyvinyltransferase [unclassified Acidisoma]|jgi:UDP-N-acetylglucosamine 1-carboxyvinyltransferase|uniref:UDP-N-acetylglucosamine 1-carboxyvinyltransferase n=1 Tax=unclassified Acidisoma TaxID=2634065 RepID=UPI00131A88CC|nr:MULTISPECIES: UDP-N-acetylglucosamine 1-carboxyvinyltransferase [unclassified Acidisoma]